jgi:hypothetical protein
MTTGVAMSKPLVINSAGSLAKAKAELEQQWLAHRFLKMSLRTGKDRSLNQNDLSHLWYEQISRTLKEDTPEGVKNECKWRFGVPILMAQDPEFRQVFGNVLRNMSYENAIKAMSYIPVTSIMTVPQMRQYMKDMQDDYGRRGMILESKEKAA